MKKLLFLAFFATFTFAETSDILSYTFQTELESNSTNSFKFGYSQTLDVDCQLLSISPIDQLPQKVKLTFCRLQAKAQYGEHHYEFDSDITDDHSLEFQSLKKLIGKPITLSLNRDMSFQRPLQELQDLVHFSAQEKGCLSEDLIEQIVETIFLPVREKACGKTFPLKIYFPIKAQKEITLPTREGSTYYSFNLDQPLNIEGLFLSDSQPFSMQLSGKVKATSKWRKKKFYLERFSCEHKLEESQSEFLFDTPLLFDYSCSLKLKTHDNN